MKISEEFFENLVLEVNYYLDEEVGLSLVEACEGVIADSSWDTIDYLLFVYLTDQMFNSHKTGFYGFLEDIQEFMEVEAPKRLKKLWWKRYPTGVVDTEVEEEKVG